jgi:hypothetical protein
METLPKILVLAAVPKEGDSFYAGLNGVDVIAVRDAINNIPYVTRDAQVFLPDDISFISQINYGLTRISGGRPENLFTVPFASLSETAFDAVVYICGGKREYDLWETVFKDSPTLNCAFRTTDGAAKKIYDTDENARFFGRNTYVFGNQLDKLVKQLKNIL